MAHSPNHLGAFNTMDPLGMKYFLGTLEFMTERYTRPDGKYGQMSSLIIGNEIQQHWMWYNMGDIEEDTFLREYETTLRLAWLACSKSHPDLRVYVSMDHHWARRGFKNNPLREIPRQCCLGKNCGL